MQKRDRELSFDSANEDSLPTGEPIAEAGESKGLKLILDAHSNLVAGSSISEDVDGFLATVDAPNQFPMTLRKTVFLRPGHSNNVAIKVSR